MSPEALGFLVLRPRGRQSTHGEEPSLTGATGVRFQLRTLTLPDPTLQSHHLWVTLLALQQSPFMTLSLPAKCNQKWKWALLVLRTTGLCLCPDVETWMAKASPFFPKWALTAENPGRQMLRSDCERSAEWFAAPAVT